MPLAWRANVSVMSSNGRHDMTLAPPSNFSSQNRAHDKQSSLLNEAVSTAEIIHCLLFLWVTW
jgi:hypothetical protein